MKCERCIQEGKKSEIRVGGRFTTDMGKHEFYDEDGQYHLHDPNEMIIYYSCSNGHEWSVGHKNYCLTCNPNAEFDLK